MNIEIIDHASLAIIATVTGYDRPCAGERIILHRDAPQEGQLTCEQFRVVEVRHRYRDLSLSNFPVEVVVEPIQPEQ